MAFAGFSIWTFRKLFRIPLILISLAFLSIFTGSGITYLVLTFVPSLLAQ